MSRDVSALRGGQVPAPLVRQITLPHVDYVDLHQLVEPQAQVHRSRDWARAMFEDDRPAVVRARYHGLLGLMLSRTPPGGQVAGWTVVDERDTSIRMQSHTASTRDEVLVWTTPEGVSLLTAVQYLRRRGSLIWPPLAHLHRRFAPRVLRKAQDQLNGPDPRSRPGAIPEGLTENHA